MKKADGQLYEAMRNAIQVTELSGKKVPKAVLLSQCASTMLKEVTDSMKYKDVLPKRDILAIENLNILLMNNDAFILPYPYYFFLKKKLGLITREEDDKIFKFPKVAYCSKYTGQQVYKKLYDYFSRYDVRDDEFIYVLGKVADSMLIEPHMFELDSLLDTCDLPKTKECVEEIQ